MSDVLKIVEQAQAHFDAANRMNLTMFANIAKRLGQATSRPLIEPLDPPSYHNWHSYQSPQQACDITYNAIQDTLKNPKPAFAKTLLACLKPR